MTLKQAYVTMKVYWDTETCPERQNGKDCKLHPRKPKTPSEVREDVSKFFERSTVFKTFVTSVGGISDSK